MLPGCSHNCKRVRSDCGEGGGGGKGEGGGGGGKGGYPSLTSVSVPPPHSDFFFFLVIATFLAVWQRKQVHCCASLPSKKILY